MTDQKYKLVDTSGTVVSMFHKLFIYDGISGDLLWRASRGNAAAGDIVGAISKRSRTSYRHTMVAGKDYLVHRIVWAMNYGHLPQGQIDHINGNGLDNRLSNLRVVSAAENQHNTCMRKNNTSGFNGVSWHSRYEQWGVSISVNGKSIFLGRYNNLRDAIEKRKEANRKYGFSRRHGMEPLNKEKRCEQ